MPSKSNPSWTICRRERAPKGTPGPKTKLVDVGSYGYALEWIQEQPADPEGVLEIVRNNTTIIDTFVWKPVTKKWVRRGARHDSTMDLVHNTFKHRQ